MKCVSVVGIGPGNELYLSIAAKETLEDSDLIVGYKKYVELVEEYLPEKEYFGQKGRHTLLLRGRSRDRLRL
jgi:precorrin-3B C17-methyltransferase